MNAPDPILEVKPAYPFAPGEYPCSLLTNEQYHSIDALSASGIKRLRQSPAHYRWERDNPKDSSEAQERGTALHMAVLEPARYNATMAVIPEDAPKRPTAAQLRAKKPSPESVESIIYWENFDRENAGKQVLTRDEFNKVEAMAGAIRRHPMASALLNPEEGVPEHSFLWTDPRLDIPCKCRFDFLRFDGFGVDLKTCTDASPDGFGRAAAKWQYHLQAAWYNDGHQKVRDESLRGFVFIAVESAAPYGCAVYLCPPNAIMFGADRCEEAMLLYKQATSSNYWRGYSDAVQPLQLPRWATTVSTPFQF